ncbi:chemotaxis protein CheW [Oligoflexus tunisiensis]|uniref:chemotaxis protein CheW n=1 Tax=Oligoflexus tunisiensis TaxID=708132 RepID=UPI00159F1A07|nr:chemotaxis protein CheW [Oligoflexus tunisiensis]
MSQETFTEKMLLVEDGEGITVSNDKLDHFMELADELLAFRNLFHGYVKQRIAHLTTDDGLEEMNKTLSRLTDDLQTQVMDIRKVSLHKAFAQFARLVPSYETEGLDLEVDKTVAQSLAASLLPVMRNACGTLRLVASQAGDMITLRVEDGSAEGPGSGLNDVKTAVSSLGGTVIFESVKDQGTTLTLQIPLRKSIGVEQSLVATSSGILIAIPLRSIREIKPVKDLDFSYMKPFWMMEHSGKSIPIATYQQLMRPETIDQYKFDLAADELAVVIMHNDSGVALRIDEVKDQLETVTRPFDCITQVVPGFKGISHLPGDQLAYMVSAEDFLELVSQHCMAPATSLAA